ncbi:TPA: hypothetical protein RI760_002733 [Vibrio cholerae]|uniref:hypothetical protein n=1 Tax=Vibrio cholerae TaxID=666 RepID=UPI0013B40A1F|nr:hypothetical protein [Vibrio cholerae]EJL6701819.1 hypothetical protein [Vibrio cholerae]ELJ8713638.1 hypothetical protein [Vibrio cholerae]HAS3612606.1 hypothetical protein [Vibrio cholerae]HDV5419550.1 hypothetical protein [Vibrio cholerae]HDV5616836.1 hypothetical protein [Vibrio cholerae]
MDNQEIVCKVSNAKARGAQAHFGQFRVKRSLSNSWLSITEADNEAVMLLGVTSALFIKPQSPMR